MNASVYRRQRDEAQTKLQKAVELASELARQVRISGAFDDHGHPLYNLQALHETERFLAGMPQGYNIAATVTGRTSSEREIGPDPGGHFQGHNG